MTEPAVRITFVSPHAVQGGAEAVMRTLLEELGADWVAGLVVLQDGPFAEDLRTMGHDVTVVATSARFTGMVGAAYRLRAVIRDQRPDIVHANGIKAALVGGIATLGLRTKLLWMKHDTAGDDLLSRVVGWRADAIVGVSGTVLRPFRGRARRRSAVVYNGLPARRVDRERGRRIAVEALQCGPDAKIVALAARLCIGKGQHELIASAPAILAGHPEVRFAIVGGDDPAFPGHIETLRAQARELGVEDAFAFLGRRDNAVELMSGCDLVVAPSIRDDAHGWREGFGLVPVEALQVGTPVVAYASGSLPEVLGEAAVLVPEGDREALAAAVCELLDDPVRCRRLAELGVARASNMYGLDRSIAAMREHYLALARCRA